MQKGVENLETVYDLCACQVRDNESKEQLWQDHAIILYVGREMHQMHLGVNLIEGTLLNVKKQPLRWVPLSIWTLNTS